MQNSTAPHPSKICHGPFAIWSLKFEIWGLQFGIWVLGFGISFGLAACATPTPTGLATPTPQTIVVTSASTAVASLVPGPTATPAPTATPVPLELVVCQKDEPLSLYLYGDDVTARAGLFAALYDGPIDTVGFGYQPVILEALPSLENGGLQVNEIVAQPGDRVVDSLTGAVVPLAAGMQLAQPDGSLVTYTGDQPARTVQLVATFRLKPNLRWSDGEPLTADDSRFSFEVAALPDTPTSKFSVDRTARYEALDPQTTQWTGLPGWRDPNFFLHFWHPLPRHTLSALSGTELLADPGATLHPLSWGPFMIEDWARGHHLTLVRNPYYFRAAEGLPRVDRVTFRFGLSPDAIVNELLAGQCHLGSAVTDFTGQIPLLLNAHDTNTLAPQFVSSLTFEHLDFGLQPSEDYKPSPAATLLRDVRARQAVAYCLDRRALADQLTNGLAEVPPAYVPAAHPYYIAGQTPQYAFEPARGQALLTELGWTDSDGDGVRDNGPDKLSLTYASGPQTSLFRKTLATLIQAQLLANCGIEVLPQFYAQEDLYNLWPDGVLFGRKFDLGEFPWRAGIEPPCELYLTEALPTDLNPGGANNTGYSNPAFDAACRAARAALDEGTRQAQHAAALALFAQDLPSLPLFTRLRVGVAVPPVVGYQLDATAASDLWNIEILSLPRP